MRRRLSILMAGALAAALATLGPATSVVRGQAATSKSAPASSAAIQINPSEVPITFGRSGQNVAVKVVGNARFSAVVLRAYGRVWSDPVQLDKEVAEIKIPPIRVPTVFSVTPPDMPNWEVGQLVAYPDRNVEWDKKLTLYSAGAPAWFGQWSAAAGLPVTQLAPADLAAFKPAPAEPNTGSLLIVGRGVAGKGLSDLVKLANEKKVNVLVLDADWFGDAAGPANVAPAQMLGGLAEIAKQHWPEPLKFATHRQPWGGIANRWAWILDEHGLPLVEMVFAGSSKDRVDQAVTLSYVPFGLQLGRNESADASLLELLAGVAKSAAPQVGGYHGVVVTGRPMELLPEREPPRVGHTWRAFITMPDRPVLSAILSVDKITNMGPSQLDILDIRGKQALTAELRDFVEKPASRGGNGWTVLILGDDKGLDEWEWLKLDRAKKTIHRPGVVWLSDDELPASKDSQIRLMLKLTELGVLLAPPGEQENQK
jgi:hypothetical protein